MEEFYMAKQEHNENITQWSCRLRGLASRTCEVGALKAEELQGRLRNKFWSGLHNTEIRNALRHRFDNQESFELLVKAARLVESEQPSTKVKKQGHTVHVQQHQQSAVKESVKLDEILEHIKKLEGRLEGLEQKSRPRCYNCGDPSHKKPQCPLLQPAQTVQRGYRGRRRGYFSRRSRGDQDQNKNQNQDHLNMEKTPPKGE